MVQSFHWESCSGLIPIDGQFYLYFCCFLQDEQLNAVDSLIDGMDLTKAARQVSVGFLPCLAGGNVFGLAYFFIWRTAPAWSHYNTLFYDVSQWAFEFMIIV